MKLTDRQIEQIRIQYRKALLGRDMFIQQMTMLNDIINDSLDIPKGVVEYLPSGGYGYTPNVDETNHTYMWVDDLISDMYKGIDITREHIIDSTTF